MELTASRAAARTGPSGEPVLLADQDRARWDRLLIGRGLAALERAEGADRDESTGPRGRYALQAAIGACHARAHSTASTDWQRIADLYAELARVAPSPIVELNRAVAVSMVSGPAQGLALVDALVSEPSLQRYHLLPGARGDLLEKLGRFDEARAEFERAASLTRNVPERDLLRARARVCGGKHESDEGGPERAQRGDGSVDRVGSGR
jgi:RNA polymerase sigma-70 factor (ECF subfamily)